jgi:gluconolactonase
MLCRSQNPAGNNRYHNRKGLVMKPITLKITMILVSLIISGTDPEQKPEAHPVVSPDAVIEKLSDGFVFTEGPAADTKGNVYFTDIPNNRIHKWSTDGELSTFMENSGGANGLYFDKDGNLIACAGGTGKLVSIDLKGKTTVLAESYQGEPFNSPNDLWIDAKGGIYFTDPRYGPRENLPQNGEHVYYLFPDNKRVIRVIDDMIRPNGVIGTPDGKLLYVADHGASKTYVYTINPDGTLSDKKLFDEPGSDGMTLDKNGNVYLTADAVTVYDPSEKQLEIIDVPERPSNVCFGGQDNTTLFITARTSLYAIRMQVKGR